MIDKILDTAGQKGTGKWTAISALDLGQPVTLIGESVFARCLSALKDERVAASKVLQGPKKVLTISEKKEFIEDVRRALYCSKMISYAQGYMLLRAVEKEQNWELNMGGIALMWRGGCIIRSVFLGNIKAAFDKNPKLQNLLLDDFFSSALNKYRLVVAQGDHSRDRDRRADCRRSLQRWRSTTATGRSGCRRICCRRSATSSARTRMSVWTSRVASSSTRTGPDAAEGSRRRHTTLRFGYEVKEGEPLWLALFRFLRGGGVWARLEELLQMLPGVVGEDADDANGHGSCSKSQDADERLI